MRLLFPVILLFFCFIGCYAQNIEDADTVTLTDESTKLLHSINTGGGSVSGVNGSGSYAIGQLFFGDLNSPAHTIKEGILQQKENSLSVDTNTIAIAAYPNPTTDYFFVEVDEFKSRNLNYQLVNLQGKILTKNLIQDFKTKITSTFLHQGIYIISVLDGNVLLKSLKIIKY